MIWRQLNFFSHHLDYWKERSRHASERIMVTLIELKTRGSKLLSILIKSLTCVFK